MSAALVTTTVAYLGLVTVLALAAAGGAPVETAARTGLTVGMVLVAAVIAVDVVGLAAGHDPREKATHIGYLVAAPAVAWVVLGRRPHGERAPLVLVALVSGVVGVVVIRMGQTWP